MKSSKPTTSPDSLELHAARRTRLAKALPEGVDTMIIFGSDNISIQREIYYLTGLWASFGLLIIRRGSSDILVADPRYREQSLELKDPGLELGDYFKVRQILEDAVGGLERAGFSSSLSYRQFRFIEEHAKDAELVDCSPQLRAQMMIKDTSEISSITKARDITLDALKAIEPMIQPGASELDIANQLELEMKGLGAARLAFDTICASGPNSARAHSQPATRKLKTGETLLIDCGAEFQHYASDITRTFFVGKPSSRALEVEDAVHRAYDAAALVLKPGNKLSQLGSAAQEILDSAGYGDKMGHALGHGVGLDVHEDPHISGKSDLVIQSGLVVAIEPGIYLPDEAIGYRHENTLVVP